MTVTMTMKAEPSSNPEIRRPNRNPSSRPELSLSPGTCADAPTDCRRGAGWTVALVALLCAFANPTPAVAQSGIPSAINYQGKLTDNLGQPVPTGYYEVSFRIWDDSTQVGAGNYIWGRNFPLNVVTNGMFNVLLTDDGTQINSPGTPGVASLLQAFEGPNRFLGLAVTRNPQGPVAVPTEISPRQQLVTAPFAIHAYQATLADRAGFATNATEAVYALKAGASQFSATNGLLVEGSTTLKGSVTLSGTVTLPKSDATTNGGFVPVGGIIMWSGTTLPAGWALCNGTTTNGLVTPDLRGRFVLGSGSGSGLTPRALTDPPGGEEMHKLSVSEMPSHTHDVKFKTFNNQDARADGTRDIAGPDYAAWDTWNKFTSVAAGGGEAHNNMPPYYVLAYIIRVQ